MPYADALADIDATLAAPPPPASDAGAPPVHPALADIDAALSGYKPQPEATAARPSAASNVLAGVNSGLISDTLGMPVDLATAAMNLVPRAINSTGRALGYQPDVGLIQHPVGGSEWFDTQLGKAGIGTKGIAPPESAAERVEQSAGRGLGMMVGPNVLAKGHLLSGIVGPAVEEALSAGSVPANAALGAGSGITGQVGAEVAPKGYEPVGYLLGSLVPGGAMAAGAAAASGLGRGARSAYAAIPPLRESTRETAASQGAADRFRAAASDPGSALESIETASRELVPGSLPTTAELSGDIGLLGAQRHREGNSPDFGREVLEQRGDNATARMDFLEGQAPRTASVEATQNALRQHLANIDAAGDQAANYFRGSAQNALPEVATTPEEMGAAARGAVEAERVPASAQLAAQEQGAQGALNEATGAFGGQEALAGPEAAAAAPAAYGAAMREPLATKYANEKQGVQALRDAIDPHNTMGMRPDAIQGAIQKIGELFPPETGAQLSGPEQHLYNTAQNWGSLVPIEHVFGLRANINGRLRGLQGSDPQEAMRLGILKQGVDDALAQAVADVHAGEQNGVIHQGLPGINERVTSLENDLGLGPSFAQDVARAYANNPATLRAAGRDETGRGVLEIANSGDDALRTGTLSDRSGGRGQGQGRPGDSAGDQGVPQNPELTPLTPEAQERFADWNAAYRKMGQTFRGETPGTLHAVGKILQKGGAYDSYRMTDAEVPWLFVNKGPNARQAVDRFLNAAPEEAHAALDDAMAFSLRRAAQKSDGTLDLPKYERWLKDHGAAVSARPELMQKFGNAAQAQRQLDGIREALAQHAAEHPLKPGWSDASLLGRFFKPGPEGAEKMREYARITGDRPEAAAAATDYAAFSFANAAVRDGEVVPRLAENWLRQHDQALSAVPGLKDRFADAVEAQRTLEYNIAIHQQARSDFTRSVAGAFIQDDPARAIERVFTGANRQQKAQLLMQLTKSNTAATEGLQRAAIDYIRQKFEGAPVPGSEAGAVMPKRFADFVGQNRDVLTALFPGRIANFDALAKDLERSSLVPGAKVNRAGSDTAELTAGHGGEHGDIGAAATVLVAEHLGQHAAHHLGSTLLGAAAPPVALVGRSLIAKAKEALRIREEALFDRMLLEPDFALHLNKAHPATAKVSRDSIMGRLRGRLVQQAIVSARGSGLQ